MKKYLIICFFSFTVSPAFARDDDPPAAPTPAPAHCTVGPPTCQCSGTECSYVDIGIKDIVGTSRCSSGSGKDKTCIICYAKTKTCTCKSVKGEKACKELFAGF